MLRDRYINTIIYINISDSKILKYWSNYSLLGSASNRKKIACLCPEMVLTMVCTKWGAKTGAKAGAKIIAYWFPRWPKIIKSKRGFIGGGYKKI